MKSSSIIFLIFLSTCRLNSCAAVENPCPKAQKNQEHEIVLHVGRDGTFVRKLAPSKNPHKGDSRSQYSLYKGLLAAESRSKAAKNKLLPAAAAAATPFSASPNKPSLGKQDRANKTDSEDESFLVDMPCESEDSDSSDQPSCHSWRNSMPAKDGVRRLT